MVLSDNIGTWAGRGGLLTCCIGWQRALAPMTRLAMRITIHSPSIASAYISRLIHCLGPLRSSKLLVELSQMDLLGTCVV